LSDQPVQVGWRATAERTIAERTAAAAERAARTARAAFRLRTFLAVVVFWTLVAAEVPPRAWRGLLVFVSAR
jgi:hypothetical protein